MARSPNSSPYQDYINKAEDFADQILRHLKHVLPHIARFCLVSTFFEDGVRMWFQWGEQRDYFSQTWNCSSVFGLLFVLFNLFGQLAGVAMVLARQKVEIAVGILGAVIVVQVYIKAFNLKDLVTALQRDKISCGESMCFWTLKEYLLLSVVGGSLADIQKIYGLRSTVVCRRQVIFFTRAMFDLKFPP